MSLELALGLSLGLSAGVAPGPLVALIVQRTLEGGFWRGLRVAVAPLLSDLPIVGLSLWLVGQVPAAGLLVLRIAGSLFIAWLAVEAWRRAGTSRAAGPVTVTARRDLAHGVLINLLNPHPYLFWATVGGPIVIGAWRDGRTGGVVVFLAAFYGLLVGGKVAVAAVVTRLRGRSQVLRARSGRLAAILLGAAGGLLWVS